MLEGWMRIPLSFLLQTGERKWPKTGEIEVIGLLNWYKLVTSTETAFLVEPSSS